MDIDTIDCEVTDHRVDDESKTVILTLEMLEDAIIANGDVLTLWFYAGDEETLSVDIERQRNDGP